MPRILIIGATGNVGGELAKIFSRENLPVVAAVCNPKIIGDFPRNVETRWFDITEAKTFAVALRDVRKIFLLRPPAVSNVRRDIFPFLKFCKNAEIEQIVLLSILGAQNAAYLPHRKIELEIQRLEIPYTFLRPSYFMQNFSTVHREEIKNKNEIYVPAGSGKTSFVDVRDVAEVAFKAFFDARMTNQLLLQEFTAIERSYDTPRDWQSVGRRFESRTAYQYQEGLRRNPGPFSILA